MDESSTIPAKSKRDIAIDVLSDFIAGAERSESHLLEILASLELYLKDNDIVCPNISDKEELQLTEYESILHQLSLIADKIFAAKDYILCSRVIEIAINILDQRLLGDGEPNASSKNALLLKLASCYLHLDKCQACIKVATACQKEGIEKGNKLLEMQSCIILANAFQRDCNFIEAIRYNSMMLGIGQHLNESEREHIDWGNQLECKILWNISACFNSINDPENALLYAKKYLHRVEYGSQENLTNMYSYTGKLERLTGQYQEALYMHELELAICKRYNDRKGMGNAYGNIGLVYASMGNDTMSKEFLNQQFLIAKSLEDSESLLNATKIQAESLMKLGKISPAIESFKTLLKLARENHLWDVQCSAYRNIGKLYHKQGTLNFARHYLDQAVHRAKERFMKEEAIDAEMHLAQVLHILGYYEEARKHFKEVVIYLEKTIDTLQHYDIKPCTSMSIKLADCCRDLQDVLVKLERFKEALEIAELKKSTVHFNVLKREIRSRQQLMMDNLMPLTYSYIEAVLKYLPSGSVVLYYALSADGYHLWMMTPENGLVKFVTQNSLASCPIETLVRDCVKSLAITNKGNRCCYDTENRRKLLHQARNLKDDPSIKSHSVGVMHSSNASSYEQEWLKMSNIKEANDYATLNVHTGKSGDYENIDNSRGSGSCPLSPSLTSPLTPSFNPSVTSRLTSPLNSNSPLKLQKDSTYDSGYDSSFSRNLELRDKAKKSDGTQTGVDVGVDDSILDELRNQRTAKQEINQKSLHVKLRKELFKRLLGQVEHLLTDLSKNTRIIFIPDGVLNIVPFNLLLDKNGEALHQNFLVSILPCLAAMNNWKNSIGDDISSSLAIGNSTLIDAVFRNFTGDIVSQETDDSAEELNLVSRILGIRAISGHEATKDKLVDALPVADVVHITSLGSITDGFLLMTPNSNREFPKAEEESYIFTLEDLSHLELKAKLVILSGCSQCPHGLCEIDEANLDLVTGFLGAGAMAVVVFLYSLPHKAQLCVIHRLFRLLEMGNSVCEALQFIYNEMSTSEDMSHPGNWGGVIFVGRDTYVDVKTARRKALEDTIDKSSELIRGSVCLGDDRIDLDELNLSTKAKTLQSIMAEILSENSNKVVLDAFSNLLSLSINMIPEFATQAKAKPPPAVKLSSALLNLSSVRDFLGVLGYELEASLEEVDVVYVMLPAWNFDGILERSLSLVRSLKAMQLLSEKAIFSLSRCLAELDEDALSVIVEMLYSLRSDPDRHINTTDIGVSRMWVSPRIKRFLINIGFTEVNTSLLLRNGKTYDQLQVITIDFMSVLLSMHEDGEVLMSQLNARKLKKPAAWMTKKSTRDENKSKNLLAKRILATKKEFKTLNKIGRQWHDATLRSWVPPDLSVVEIGQESKDPQKAERDYHGLTKVKVKPGGKPSSCRLPIIEKRKVTKYDRYQQRETLEQIYLQKRKDLSKRKELQIYKSFAMSNV